MSDSGVVVGPPALPSWQALSDPERAIGTRCGKALLVYEPATQTGMVCRLEDGYWAISVPIAFDAFVLLVASCGYQLAEGSEARRWYESNRRPAHSGALH